MFHETANKKWMILHKPDFITLVDENKKEYGDVVVRRFVFKANAVGEGDLIFVFRNGTDPSSPELERKVYHVVVK